MRIAKSVDKNVQIGFGGSIRGVQKKFMEKFAYMYPPGSPKLQEAAEQWAKALNWSDDPPKK